MSEKSNENEIILLPGRLTKTSLDDKIDDTSRRWRAKERRIMCYD
jgi:hypothetical protein